jgi:protease II
LLLKCETAGHGGKTGRDNSISELAEEFAFILKSADIKK